MRLTAHIVACLLPLSPAFAADLAALVDEAVETQVLPGFRTLADETAELAEVAQDHCDPGDPQLEAAWGDAFDAWIRVSHLRFGPTETGDRAFGLAFWPDSRGMTPKALRGLVSAEDPVIDSLDGFATVSIAARGFYAMEFLLYDPAFAGAEDASGYRCRLVGRMAGDIAETTAAIRDDWENGYAELMRHPGNETYRDTEEAARQLFTALVTGLEFTEETRMGRPMGTFERPRPARAEARRSERSLHHVVLSLEGTRGLAMVLSENDPQIAAAYGHALERASKLDDPAFAGTGNPMGRLRVEVLQQAVGEIRDLLGTEVGPRLGIAAGFNSMDGD